MQERDSLFLLLAEDDENDAFFFKLALSKANIHGPVRIVRDGEEVVDYLSGKGKFGRRDEHPLPDMMFLDVKMPKRNGFEVLEWVRSQAHFRHLPILVVSTSNEDEDRERADGLCASAYLQKHGSIEVFSKELKKFYDFWKSHCVARKEK